MTATTDSKDETASAITTLKKRVGDLELENRVIRENNATLAAANLRLRGEIKELSLAIPKKKDVPKPKKKPTKRRKKK